ncbi:MAG: DUF2330 domain-containing protein, partial [Candidatus Binatia bacterium]
KTVISMMNDYEGELAEFALVVPVPEVLNKGQIHIGDRELFRRIDAYSAPRLVEYFDPDPCQPRVMYEMSAQSGGAPAPRMARADRAKSLGVTVEAEYTVGEYDIVILSAKESGGLETWLVESGYKIPAGAAQVLAPYLKQDMKFFVAKVNLEEQKKTGVSYLRPLQFAFKSPKFMLPIRLGMMNAKPGQNAEQDLLVFVLTKNGRVETTNYRNVMLPTGMDVPVHVKEEFGDFYKAMFAKQVADARAAAFTEYFWNMGWCDPCAEDPLKPEELKKLGVFWLNEAQPSGTSPQPRIMPMPMPGGGVPVMVTRIHVRTTPDAFPEDLVFQETNDQQNFQARYVLRHAWKGSATQCDAAKTYFKQLDERREREAKTLADLTGWELADVRKKMSLDEAKPTPAKDGKWWEGLWE